MAWIVENRRQQVVQRRAEPYLTEEMKTELRDKYFPRYPTKRAVLLPALHMTQHAHGWLPAQALEEIAELLEISPAEVLDTASFYEEYWLKPKGQYLVQVCRSLSCEILGSRDLTDHLQSKLNILENDTTPDGKFTLVELECLGSCGTAPCMLVNDVLYENLTTESVDQLIAKLPPNPNDQHDPGISWHEEGHPHGDGRPSEGRPERLDRDPHTTRN